MEKDGRVSAELCSQDSGSDHDRYLQTHDIVIGPESPEDHVTQKYTNTIVGRYANRIPVGTHVLERKGVKSQFNALSNGKQRPDLIPLVLSQLFYFIAQSHPKCRCMVDPSVLIPFRGPCFLPRTLPRFLARQS